MSIRPARVRTIVMAVLVLAFVIPQTYAHTAYSWDWKERSAGETCTDRYYLTPCDKQRSVRPGTISDGCLVYIGISGKVSMGHQISSFGLSARDNNGHFDFLEGAGDLHLGDTTTIEGVNTFTLKETHSGTVWLTSNPGRVTFCFDPSPTFTSRNFP